MKTLADLQSLIDRVVCMNAYDGMDFSAEDARLSASLRAANRTRELEFDIRRRFGDKADQVMEEGQ